MNRVELIFNAILLPLDYLAIVLAGIAAYHLRFGSWISEIRPVLYEIPLEEFIPIVLAVAILGVLVFATGGLYAMKTTRRRIEELSRIILACSTTVLLLILLIFFQRELFSSRFIILSGWVLAILFTSTERSIVRFIQGLLLRRSIGVHRVILLRGKQAEDPIANEIREQPMIGYRIVHEIEVVDEREAFADLERSFIEMTPDEVIQTDPDLPKSFILRIIDFCNERHATFKYAANLFEAQAMTVDITPLAGIPIVEIKRTPLDGWGKILKRIFDVLLSFTGLTVLSPFFLLVGLAVKWDSAGPMFVALDRVGRKGTIFLLYKFRSMVEGAHRLKSKLTPLNERSDGPLFKMANDPRLTRFGRWIRRFSIDEFPQLLNVLRGEMSLVGPRPHEPEEVSQYEKHHQKLLAIKPGITGFAQISGRSDLSFEDEARLDTYYIEHWSLLLDLQILLKTPFVLFQRRSAP